MFFKSNDITLLFSLLHPVIKALTKSSLFLVFVSQATSIYINNSFYPSVFYFRLPTNMTKC